MNVLFIGGTGIISSAVSRLAVESGFSLYLLNRGTQRDFEAEGARTIQGDIRNTDQIRDILTGSGIEFDVVVDWIGFLPEHAENDIRLFEGRVGQYIFISSASAYQKPVGHYRITEKTPLVNPYWQYSQDKIACEDILMKAYYQKGFPVTIVRPSHTYGDKMIPAAFNSRKYRYSILERMKRGKKIIIPGDGTSLWVLTHNTDFAKGFAGLIGNREAIGEAFHITSDEVLNWNQITGILGKAIGVEPEITHLSSEFIARCLPDRYGELYGDKMNSVCFDNSKIKSFVPGYNATKPFEQGIRETLEWHMKHPELMQMDPEWDQICDKLIVAGEKAYDYFDEP